VSPPESPRTDPASEVRVADLLEWAAAYLAWAAEDHPEIVDRVHSAAPPAS
jgi:hypothetical protein